jgi:membrane associated rhomboid family serine protease
MFNIPPLTLYAIAAIVAVQTIFSFAPQSWVQTWGYNLAFVPGRYTNLYLFNLFALTSPFTHLFVHGGWLHVAMNTTMLMAFGAATERMVGAKKTAALFILCGFAGAFVQFLLNPSTPIPMVGASGALSGLFAAVILRLQAAGQMAAGKLGIWSVAALWIGLSFVTAFIGGDIGIGNVAWGAHAGGFLAGIGLMKLKYFKEA